MIKVIPVCQIHGDELRQEYLIDHETGGGYISGFCHKCAKHHRLCSAVRYTTSCLRLHEHQGEHIDIDGMKWTGEWRH